MGAKGRHLGQSQSEKPKEKPRRKSRLLPLTSPSQAEGLGLPVTILGCSPLLQASVHGLRKAPLPSTGLELVVTWHP